MQVSDEMVKVAADAFVASYVDDDKTQIEAMRDALTAALSLSGWRTIDSAPKDGTSSDRERIALADCPIGLFLSESGELCLKTEYGNNEGRIDAYIVSTGEFFWGSQPQTIASQRAQIVTPVSIDDAILSRRSVR